VGAAADSLFALREPAFLKRFHAAVHYQAAELVCPSRRASRSAKSQDLSSYAETGGDRHGAVAQAAQIAEPLRDLPLRRGCRENSDASTAL
jgi:hypothetical protein